MRSSNTLKQGNNRLKVSSSFIDQNILNIIASKMKNHLASLNVSPTLHNQLTTLTNLEQLIQKFAQITAQSLISNTAATASTLQKQAIFYRERIGQLEKKIKDQKQEILTHMKNISAKQVEINDKDNEIFQLKLILEEKQKNIIRLTMRKNQQKKQESEIKIIVNSPKVEEKPQLKIVKKESIDIAGWAQQKARLVKVIKEKDLKIYELIQQLQSKS